MFVSQAKEKTIGILGSWHDWFDDLCKTMKASQFQPMSKPPQHLLETVGTTTGKSLKQRKERVRGRVYTLYQPERHYFITWIQSAVDDPDDTTNTTRPPRHLLQRDGCRGGIRFCVDYCKLNELTMEDRYPSCTYLPAYCNLETEKRTVCVGTGALATCSTRGTMQLLLDKEIAWCWCWCCGRMESGTRWLDAV